VVGAFFGIAAYDAAVGQNVEVHLVGVFELPKAADIAIDQGDPCYWDSLAVTNVGASGNLLIGGCTESVLSSAPTVRVRLNGMTVY
jgi:predicted RecA/RadA family phage recombinase